MDGPAIELTAAVKRFGDRGAVDGISLSIPHGQTVALLGPNGAGKTTSIALMLGLRSPTEGTARLLGGSPTDPAARARVGVMLQESGVPGTLTIGEVLDLWRSFYPRPLARAVAIVRAGLAGMERKFVGSLSGGQKQRLYFALAICGDPEVLFLDEPTVGMDVESRRQFWSQVHDFKARGRTLVLTTHYLEEAEALADRVVVIDRGRVVADGDPKALSGTRKATIRFSSAGFTAAPLAGLAARVESVGDCIEIHTPEPEEALRRLFAAGTSIAQLTVENAGLEEAFLSLIAAERTA